MRNGKGFSSMSYIRISLMKPRKGQEEEVRRLIDDLVMFQETLPGYQVGYRVEHTPGDDRVGRLAIWAHESDADRAALNDHDMAIRSQLNQLIEPESHEEQTMYGHYAPKV
jgi:hypothetical protein